MSSEQMQQAKILIQQKRYTEARAILWNINTPTARKWLAQLDAVAPAQLKSYTLHAVLVIVLYLFFFVPGLIANVIFYNEGKRMEQIAGVPLPGVGALAVLKRFSLLILLAALALLVLVLIIPMVGSLR